MNQQRKFENKKAYLINGVGQRSLYIGLLFLTFFVTFILKEIYLRHKKNLNLSKY